MLDSATFHNETRAATMTRTDSGYAVELFNKTEELGHNGDEVELTEVQTLVTTRVERYRHMAFGHVLNWLDHGR